MRMAAELQRASSISQLQMELNPDVGLIAPDDHKP